MHTTSELNTILNKLATDDAFRARLEADPVSALASLGITLRPQDVPAERHLPPKEVIAAEHDILFNQLASTKVMIPFLLSGSLSYA